MIHAITALRLENFRNYASLSLALSEAPVVLRGANGAGKTNILEAISLLAPGRGLRGAKLREMDRGERSPHPKNAFQMAEGGQGSARRFSASPKGEAPAPDDTISIAPSYRASGEGLPWVVAANVMVHGEESHIGTGRDAESASDKRIIKINGERVRSAVALSTHCCIQWLTPAMDQIFVEGGSARRKFFDRLVYGFAPEHAARVTAYEQAMRERNKLLTEERGRADPYWLSVLEQQMAEHAVAITLARQEALLRLQTELREDIAHFPRAELYLSGTLEAVLEEGKSALEAESLFAERLKNERPIDAARGRAGLGPQRSEWTVIHSEKQREAAQCSTGEQKALILSILLASARARANWCGMAPILLLDEVIAHLDVDKRVQLFDLIKASRIQAWMTGTDAADFKGLEGYSTMLEIDGGMVQM